MSRWFSEDPEYSKITPEEFAIRNKIVAIIKSYKQNMQQDHWYGPNPGVPEDDFEDIADDIMIAFNMK